ncbi:hypothetical protein D3C80_751040 [compost metagenome]
MVRRHQHHQFVLAIQHAVQALDVTVDGTDPEVGHPVEHTLNHPGAGAFFEVGLDLWVTLGKIPQVLGQKLNDRRQVGEHPHVAAHTVAVLAQFKSHFLDVEQHLPGMVQQGFTGRRQGHALGLAHEQADAQRLLQLHQTLARRRDGNRFARRCTGQRALFVHGDEQLQGDQVETADQAFLQHRVLGEVGSGEVAA